MEVEKKAWYLIMLRKRIALVAVAALSLVGVMGAGAGAAEQKAEQHQRSQQQGMIIPREPYYLYNGSSNLFMITKGGNALEGGFVDLWHRHNTGTLGLREQWKFLPTAHRGVARIKNVGSGLCLQPNPNKLDPWNHVVQEQCDKGEREQWWNLRRSSGGLRISSFLNDNRVLTPYDGAAASHDIVLNQDSSSADQRWRPVLVD